MAWNDRIVEAAYTSPSGIRLTFDFENVSRNTEKKGSAFEFPDADGTFVQDLGHSGRRYPLKVIFSGNDCDQEADAFEDLLLEQGVGRLEHPLYGVADVVPFGSINRRDDLKTAANQAIITVTFWETIGIIYPTVQLDPGSEVLASIDEYNDVAAVAFEDVTDLEGAVEQSSFVNGYEALLDGAKAGLTAIAETQADVLRQFNAVTDSINNGIDVLVRDPLTLASQTVIALQAPARALTSIQARLDGYGNLARDITGQFTENSNDFHTNDLYASTYVTGSIVSVVNNEFVTRSDALEAADSILVLFGELVEWRDDSYLLLGQTDTGEAYQQLQEAVGIAAGFLVQISFSLKQERIIVLDRARTPIDLVAELYGSVDDQLDFLINSNSLTGSEILEIPKGREIAYFV